MSVQQLNPYINLNGNAAEAIEHYVGALGAEVVTVLRYGDFDQMQTGPEHKNRVLHAELRFDGKALMVSDAMPSQPVPSGGAVQVAIAYDDEAEAARRFEALAARGRVVFPFHDAFWGGKFGMVADAFGIQWMVTSAPKA